MNEIIEKLISKKKIRDFTIRIVWIIFFQLLLFLTICFCDYIFEMTISKVEMFSRLTWYFTISFLLINIVVTIKNQKYSTINTAIEIEKFFSNNIKNHNELSSAIYFKEKFKDNEKYGYSTWMIDETIKKGESKYKDLDYSPLVNYKKIILPLLLIAIIILNLFFFSMISPIFLESFYKGIRGISFNYLGPKPGILKITPGNCREIYGKSLKIIVNGSAMPNMKIFKKSVDSPTIKKFIMKKAGNKFVHTFNGITKDFYYMVKSLREESKWYMVKVIRYPYITSMNIEYDFPEYTGLTPMIDDENRNISALFGTNIKIFARSSKKLKKAIFKIGTREIEMKINSEIEATVQFKATKTCKYSIILTDSDGETNPNLESYQIEVRKDKFPLISIIKPPLFLLWDKKENPVISYRIEDDFGLSRGALIVTQNGVKTSKIIFDKEMEKRIIISDLPLKIEKSLYKNGGIVEYFIEVQDNDTISGPKLSKSKIHKLKIPSPDIKEKSFEETLKTAETRLLKLKNEQNSLIADELKLIKKMEKSMIPDAEDKKDAEYLIYKQKNIMKEAKAIKKLLKDSIKKIKDNPFVKSGIIKKMEKMQKLLREVLTPELANMMNHLDKKMENLNLTKEDFKKFTKSFDPKEMSKKYERMIKLLERMKLEQQLFSIQKKLEKLYKKELSLRKEIEKIENNNKLDKKSKDIALNELAKFQEELAAKLFRTEKKLEEIMADVKKISKKANKTLEFSIKKMDEALQKERESFNSMKNGDGNKSQNSVTEASKKIKEALNNIKNASSIMKNKRKKELENGILNCAKISYNIVVGLIYTNQRMFNANFLRDEKLKKLLDNYLRTTASTFSQLHQLTSLLLNNIIELSKKSFMINPELTIPIDNLSYKIKRLEVATMERNYSVIKYSLPAAVQNSVRLTVHLLKLYSHVKKNGSKSLMEEYLEKMKKMADMQAKLNSKMGMMGQSGGMSEEMLREMAMEQALIRKGMEEMAEGLDETSGMRQRLMQLRDEMENLEAEYLKRNIGSKIKERQKRLHQRMLETIKAMKQKGEDTKRESYEVIHYKKENNQNNIDSELKRKIDGSIKKMGKEVYPKEYEKIIKLYFEKISK